MVSIRHLLSWQIMISGLEKRVHNCPELSFGERGEDAVPHCQGFAQLTDTTNCQDLGRTQAIISLAAAGNW